MVEKTLDRLYLECIADLAEGVALMKRLTGSRYTRSVEEFELLVDQHMRSYDRWLEAEQQR